MTEVNAGGGETKEDISAWTVDSLNAHYAQVLNERDRRYEQRFVAQEKAVADAFAASEKAVKDAFVAQEKAVAAALAAQKEAVVKAESASEKRFESVNEFRAQLGDQAGTFLPRNEYLAQHNALIDKVTSGEKALEQRIENLAKAIGERIDGHAKGNSEAIARNSDLIAALGIRIERSEGQRGGLKEGWGILVGAIGLAATVIAIVYALAK